MTSPPPGNARRAAVLLGALSAAALAVAAPSTARAAPDVPRAPNAFAPAWDPLVGRWEGTLDVPDARPGEPAAARTRVEVAYDLDGRILVRRAVTELPATRDHEALRREELLVFYPAPDGRHAEAVQFDSEGHALRHACGWSADETTLTCTSFPEERSPRVRLGWQFTSPDALAQVVELAPPGGTAFRRFDGGVLRRER